MPSSKKRCISINALDVHVRLLPQPPNTIPNPTTEGAKQNWATIRKTFPSKGRCIFTNNKQIHFYTQTKFNTPIYYHKNITTHNPDIHRTIIGIKGRYLNKIQHTQWTNFFNKITLYTNRTQSQTFLYGVYQIFKSTHLE